MAVESSQCLLQELRDPKKAMSDHLSSTDGKFSWGQTTEEEHQACVGKMATNDAAESPFAALKSQSQTFGGLLGIHASATGHARTNGDFQMSINDPTQNGMFHQIPKDMKESPLLFAISTIPEVRKSEQRLLEKQRQAKMDRQKLM